MVGSHYKLNVQLGVCMIKDLQNIMRIKWQSNYCDKTCDYKENVFFNTQFCSDRVLTTGLRCLI